MKIVKIIWNDVAGMRGPLSKKEIVNQPVLEVTSVGLLVHKDKESVRIAGQTEGRRFRNISIIPRKYVTKMEELKAKE